LWFDEVSGGFIALPARCPELARRKPNCRFLLIDRIGH
jgi:hypothetical protein